jgi:hypothetical protein
VFIAPFLSGQSSIRDLIGDPFHHVGCQGAADAVADAACEPDEIVKADIVLLVEVTEGINNQGL